MIDTAKPVRVFRNWKRGCYTIMQGTHLVSARDVTLTGVQFRVRESGRRRMLRTGRKNVHAYAVGQLASFVTVDAPAADGRGRPGARFLRYDPFEAPTFFDRDSRAPVLHAERAHFGDGGATYDAPDGPLTDRLPRAA